MKSLNTLIFFIFFVSLSFSMTREQRKIGYDKYFSKITMLYHGMIKVLNNYEVRLDEISSDIGIRICIRDRIIVLKSLVNSANVFVKNTDMKRRGILESVSGDIVEKSEEEYYFFLFSGFYQIYKSFFKIYADVEACILKFDHVVDNDGDQVINVYKK